MMIDPNVVRLAVEYLDQCKTNNTQATLVGMHWHIDASNKTLPLLDEVNEALTHRPSIHVQRTNGLVIFGSDGTERAVSNEDMKRADKQYRKEFSAALKRGKLGA